MIKTLFYKLFVFIFQIYNSYIIRVSCSVLIHFSDSQPHLLEPTVRIGPGYSCLREGAIEANTRPPLDKFLYTPLVLNIYKSGFKSFQQNLKWLIHLPLSPSWKMLIKLWHFKNMSHFFPDYDKIWKGFISSRINS